MAPQSRRRSQVEGLGLDLARMHLEGETNENEVNQDNAVKHTTDKPILSSSRPLIPKLERNCMRSLRQGRHKHGCITKLGLSSVQIRKKVKKTTGSRSKKKLKSLANTAERIKAEIEDLIVQNLKEDVREKLVGILAKLEEVQVVLPPDSDQQSDDEEM